MYQFKKFHWRWKWVNKKFKQVEFMFKAQFQSRSKIFLIISVKRKKKTFPLDKTLCKSFSSQQTQSISCFPIFVIFQCEWMIIVINILYQTSNCSHLRLKEVFVIKPIKGIEFTYHFVEIIPSPIKAAAAA